MANQDLASILKFRPWPPGDPAPEIWQVIYELDRRVQVEVAKAVLDAQIAMAHAHVEGLAKVQKILGSAKLGGATRES